MTAPPASTPERSDSITAALVLWLALQLVALLFAAARIPLSAHYPQAPESLALEMMAIVQTVSLAMLAPLLLRSLVSAVAIALTAAPMIQLAAILEHAPFARVLMLWCYVIIFAAALFLWCIALGGKRAMWLVAFANLLTIGGCVLWYLAAEFASAPSPTAFTWSPTVAAVLISRAAAPALESWGAVGAILLSGAVTALVAHHRRAGRT